MGKIRTLDEIIQEELKDEESRWLYLKYALEDYFESGDEVVLLLAIRQVVRAGIGYAILSEKTGVSRNSLYRILSGRVSPKLTTFRQILSALGYTLTTTYKV